MASMKWGMALLLLVVLGCSTSFQPKTCTVDDDCGKGLVCVQEDAAAYCESSNGASIRVGMSAPVSGPSQALGTDMKLGVTLAFDAQNAAGGIRGRQLELIFRDDEYQPELAEAATDDLLDVRGGPAPPRCPTTAHPVVDGQAPVSTHELDRGPNAVLALLGNVGTPTMVRSAPIAVETGTLFFGAFTGADKILRDTSAGPCARRIFNVRASYADEARATLEYFMSADVPDARHILSFDQNDSFGQAGYDGLAKAYAELSPGASGTATAIQRFRYARDDLSSVPAQVDAAAAYLANLLGADMAHHAVGIFITGTYGPAASFITGLRDWQFAKDAQADMIHKADRLTLLFSNVSFVGPNALAARLKEAGAVATPTGMLPYTEGVMISQVVPNYESDSSDVVADYRSLISAARVAPSFTSLEGYIAARIFIAGLLAQNKPITPDSLISSFEALPSLSLGLGAASGFSTASHNYSKSVWGTALAADGTFTNIYFWSDGIPIQLFE
jgi:ABC-type branched-subunit amino acid transport system substrate-binding protein